MMDGPISDDTVRFTLNGQDVSTVGRPGQRLSEALREELGARDVKIGCNAGDCGACSVLMNGENICACLVPVQQAEGARIETASGLAQDPIAQDLGERFQDHGAAQCGICTPGMMVSAVALLRGNPTPTDDEIEAALGGVLCRCTGYRKILDAVAGRPANLGGDAIRRLDGAPKITGAEAYGDDIAPPGTLELVILRGPDAANRFTLSEIEDYVAQAPGLEALLTAADIPGLNRFGVIPGFEDQPVFAEDQTRFKGEAVAAIVGTPEAVAALDLSSLPLGWEPVASVDTPGAARTATLLHADKEQNEMCRGFVACGDAEAALAEAAVTVEGHFTSGFVEHAYIEPEAGFAQMVDGRVEVHACTQAPVMDRESLEKILDLPPDKIVIRPSGVGGGFGAKLDLSVQPYLALAALKTGKPVRLAYSRSESMQSTTKRHPSDIQLRLGADSDGTLKGFDFSGDFNTGAYASWGPTVSVRVPVHASGPYHVPNYRAEAIGIYTNTPPAGAFRGFGVPQGAIAQEVLFDDLAAACGMDPLDFRIKNALRNGLRTVCGQVFDQGVGIAACFEALRPAWADEKAKAVTTGPLRRGVGVAGGWYGCGNTSIANPSTIRAGVTPDGRIVLHQGAMDIGQGANTAIAQIFAEAMGVPLDAIDLVGPDTDVTPDAGKTSASRQTFVTGNAAQLCGASLRSAILRQVNAGDTAALAFGPGSIGVGDGTVDLSRLPPDADGYVFHASETYDPPTKPLDENGQGVPYAQYGYAAQIAVVEVDEALGTVRPIRFVAAHDVGRAINPMLVEGQVQGGIAQGLGMALMEEYIPGKTENLHDYLIPTIGDVPPIETIIIEEPDAHGPFGAKGLGEHALIPTAPALLNAIRQACDVRPRQIPMTPPRLRALIKARDHG